MFWCVLLLLLLFVDVAQPTTTTTTSSSLNLESWKFAPNSSVSSSGHEISSLDFSKAAQDWRDVRVPSTILGALVEQNVYPDPFYGENLKTIPAKPFLESWWMRTQFKLDASTCSYSRLRFKGINYRANLFINGEQVAASTEMVGTFRYFDVDITKIAKSENVVALEIFKPYNRALPPDNHDLDLAMSFVDWAPSPPDDNMGLWREVVLECSKGPVFLDSPSVETQLQKDNTVAHLTTVFQASNLAEFDVKVHIQVTIPELSVKISTDVTLNASESRMVVLSHDKFPQLKILNPKLWWPYQMGSPTLHALNVVALVNNTRSATLAAAFGIREATSKLNEKKLRQYYINGKKILVRGAGWSPDLLQRSSEEVERAQYEYMRDMGLNAVRLEGKFPSDNFFDLADKMGILVLPGWCCCDAWQHWKWWTDEQVLVARESLRSQLRRLRIHPSILVFMYSSDELPPQNIEELYLQVFKDERWPADVLSSASDRTSSTTGPTGVKMSGPYAWVPPVYWSQDRGNRNLGGAWGFLTEGGPGSSPLTIDSMVRTIPKDQLWPVGEMWNWHCGNPQGLFRDMRFFLPPLQHRYGSGVDAEDLLMKSQVTTYEAQRAMFEAYSRFKYNSATGVIQWMLNNAWPENIWHLFDSYMAKGGGYYGAKKAMEPLQCQFDPNDHSLWVVNSMYTSHPSVSIEATLYDLEANILWSETTTTKVLAEDSSLPLSVTVPHVSKNQSVALLFLTTRSSTENTVISRNVYWIPHKWDTLDWDQTTFYITNCSTFADFSKLETLPCPALDVSYEVTGNNEVKVRVENGKEGAIAFFLRLVLVDTRTEEEILPVLWSDNYITLLPGEETTLTATTIHDHQRLSVNNIALRWESYNTASGACKSMRK